MSLSSKSILRGALVSGACFGLYAVAAGCSGTADTPVFDDAGGAAPGSSGATSSSSSSGSGGSTGPAGSSSSSGGGGAADASTTPGNGSSSGGSSSGSSSGGASSSSSSGGATGGMDASTRDSGRTVRDAGAAVVDSSAPLGDGSDALAAARAQCVAIINADRATLNPPSPPLTEGTMTQEMCVDGQAMADFAANTAHSAFGQCKESAQDECPGWPGPPSSIMTNCLAQMWAEGPPPAGTDNHWLNMSNARYTHVACGFFQTPTGTWWATQDFF